MIGLAGVFAYNLVHNANGLEHILLRNRILTKLGRCGIEAIGRARDRNDAERLTKPVKVALLFNAELLTRLAAVRLQVLIHTRIPYGIGHQMRPDTQRQIEQRLRHIFGRKRELTGAGTGNRLGILVALGIVHAVQSLAFLDNRSSLSGFARGCAVKQRRHIGIPELVLARLGDRLRLGKMRDAVRDGIGDARDHIAHENIRNHAAKQKGIAVAHAIGKRTGALQQTLRLSDMNVPAWHSHPHKNLDNYTITAKPRGRLRTLYAATIPQRRFRFHTTAKAPRPHGDIDR